MMKLKKYKDFITESIEEIKESIWNLSKEEIEELFLESTDEGYFTNVDFGFVSTIKTWKGETKEVFSDKVLAGDSIRPAYWISLITGQNLTSVDVTNNLQFAASIISERANADVTLHDEDGELDLDKIQVKGGLWYEIEEPIRGYIALFVKQKETVKFSQKDVIDYYKIVKDDSLKIVDEKVYLQIELEDLADSLLSRKSDYKNILVKGPIDEFWDHYYSGDYEPDTNSLLSYTLEKETKELLAKALIKELGGLEQTINFIGDECDNDIYESVKQMSEEELIEYLLKERFYNTIKQLSQDSEIWRDVTSIVAQTECDAHGYQNYKEIMQSFDRIVDGEFKYEKIKKEVTKHYFTSNKEGQKERKEYKEKVDYYIIPFDNDWLSNVDVDYIKDKSLLTIFKEWSDENFNYSLNPYFSDYGNVNTKEINEEIKAELLRYISK